MYIQKEYIMRNTIDVERYHSGRYGAPGMKREKRKASPEDREKWNYTAACKKLKRIINANFGEGDFSVTLTYKLEERLPDEEAKKEITNFLKRIKREYKKRGYELKWIYTTEQRKKSIHHHLILNSIPETARLLTKHWKKGFVRISPLDSTGDYKDLADYIIKETDKTFRDPDSADKQRYSRSRNLIIPEPHKKIITAKTFRKEPKPIKGYYIDKDSIFIGQNPVTGYSYMTYTMVRIGGG